jgi:hypothetical protein
MEINRRILAPNALDHHRKVFPNTTLCIAEIYRKNPDMLESDILSHIWEEWATECGISINKEHIIQSNIPAVINPSIIGFLNS